MEMPGKVVAIVCTAIWVALMAKKGFHKLGVDAETEKKIEALLSAGK